jgi:endonuclease/exonuclease/phosphatase family metal-dependent hydrolase
MSYNIVHGTRTPVPPFLASRARVERTLDRIADVVSNHSVDVVALQESDGGGSLNRARWLGESAELTSVYAAPEHHGSALLSGTPLARARIHTFREGGDGKGFVVGTLPASVTGNADVSVVSVHLNAFSSSIRQRQLARLTSELRDVPRPLVVMGDFNCDDCLGSLERELDVHAYAGASPDTYVFAGVHRKLDWILISRELEFGSYRALPERLSDHRPIVADIRWKDQP